MFPNKPYNLPSQVDGIVLREEGDSVATPPCTPSPAHTVDVADGRWRKVIVDDKIHSFEVNPTTHQVGADEDPDLKDGDTPSIISSHRVKVNI